MLATLFRLFPFRRSPWSAALLAALGLQAQTDCMIAPTGVVAWWKGDGNAGDFLAANDGLLRGGATFALGKVGDAFDLDGMEGHVLVPASASLELRSFTVEAWINPEAVAEPQPIFEYAATPGAAGVHFWLAASAQGASAPGNLYAHLRATTGDYYLLETAPYLIAAHAWSHVALVYDAIQGSARIWINGGVAAAAEGVWIQPKTDLPLFIGRRPSESQEGLAGRNFWGRMDEITIYNRPLGAPEIQAIYNAGGLGKCPPELPTVSLQPRDQTVAAGSTATFEVLGFGAPPLSYQWFRDGLLLEGANSRRLTIDQVQTNMAGGYQARISNAFGNASCDPVLLRVVLGPAIIEQPRYQTTWVGGQVTLSVSATGTAPLAYQWQQDGLAIAGGIGPTLILNNVQPVHSGAYTVVVSNLGGTVISAPAILRVGSGVLASSADNGTFALSVTGEPGYDYLIEHSTDLRVWEPLAAVLDPEPSWSFSEPIQPGQAPHFYRLRRLP